ncbi:MAG TPA: hypothetical protein VM389_07810 [Phycisphaerae bacterium]|nr:hypothetical protein [Phycisphaerae bacterium]
MTSSASLVLGRLRIVTPHDHAPTAPARPDPRRLARLGLTPSAAPRQTARQTTAARPYTKATFKLPRSLAARLKAYSHATGRYQYLLVTEALDLHLDRADVAPRPPGGQDGTSDKAAPAAPPGPTPNEPSAPERSNLGKALRASLRLLRWLMPGARVESSRRQ